MSVENIVAFSNNNNLQCLGKMFLSCMGPRGRVKIFVSPTGHLTVTTSSKRMISNLEPASDFCCDAILQSLKSFLLQHENGGLYLGYFVCSSIQILKEYPLMESQNLLLTFQSVAINTLKDARVRLDVSKLSDILCVVKTVLGSKHWLSRKAKDDFSINIVQGFLSTVPDKESERSHSGFELRVVHSGEEFNRLYQGCLYRYPDIDCVQDWKFAPMFNKRGSFKTLALNLQMTLSDRDGLEEIRPVRFDVDRKNAHQEIMPEMLQKLVAVCLSLNVKVVVNQKQIAEEFRNHMEKLDILVLERFGKKDIGTFCTITKCSLISNLNFSEEAISKAVGILHTVEAIEVNEKIFFQFKGPENHSTLVAGHWNEEICEEIKVLGNNAINAIFSMCQDPVCYPGAGCFETILMLNLLKKMKNCSARKKEFTKKFLRVLSALAKSLAGHKELSDLEMDTKFGHLWQAGMESKYCQCGLVEKDASMTFEQLLSVTETFSPSQTLNGEMEYVNETGNSTSNLILDNAPVKSYQYDVVFETASSLSSINYAILT